MDMHTEFILSQKDSRPMYIQIIEQVKQKVAVGDWESGQELPSIRALAANLKISVITIKRAYLELEREGIIITRQGKGSYIADSPNIGEMLYKQELQDCLERAVELSRIMGLSITDLQNQLSALQEKKQKETS